MSLEPGEDHDNMVNLTTPVAQFVPFHTWIKDVAGIDAPKVKVAVTGKGSNDEQSRGLFATDTIYPGERIMFIPSQSLIGETFLRIRGTELDDRDRIAHHHLDHNYYTRNDSKNTKSTEMEDTVIMAIEELRKLVVAGDLTFPRQADFQWRPDDGVALFLVACRTILSRISPDEQLIGDDDASSIPQHQEPREAVEIPDAIPVAEIETLSVADICVHLDLEPSVAVEAPAVIVENSEDPGEDSSSDSIISPASSSLPHVEMLPKSFPTSPLYYSPEELVRIEGTNCHGFATRMLHQIESDWVQLKQILELFVELKHPSVVGSERPCRCQRINGGGGVEKEYDNTCIVKALYRDFTLEAYKWALMNVYSRSTDFEWTSDIQLQNEAPLPTHRRVIVPLFDMMNHDFNSDIDHHIDANGNVSVFNGESSPILPGNEIYLNYGNFPNEKLLLVYGFALPNNPFDAVQIYAPIPATDPMYLLKARLLHSMCGVSDPNSPHPLTLPISGSDNKVLPPSLLSALRLTGIQSYDQLLAIASDVAMIADAQHENSEEVPSQGEISMIDSENEYSALSALGGALRNMARQLALNLISDDGLKSVSSVPDITWGLPNIQHLASIVEDSEGENNHNISNDMNEVEKRDPHLPTTKQALAVESAKHESENETLYNARILCESEYEILQMALNEINDRLEKVT
eukprot:scaffold28117_cov56-Attheya_sp.AAC.12